MFRPALQNLLPAPPYPGRPSPPPSIWDPPNLLLQPSGASSKGRPQTLQTAEPECYLSSMFANYLQEEFFPCPE